LGSSVFSCGFMVAGRRSFLSTEVSGRCSSRLVVGILDGIPSGLAVGMVSGIPDGIPFVISEAESLCAPIAWPSSYSSRSASSSCFGRLRGGSSALSRLAFSRSCKDFFIAQHLPHFCRQLAEGETGRRFRVRLHDRLERGRRFTDGYRPWDRRLEDEILGKFLNDLRPDALIEVLACGVEGRKCH